MCRLLPTFCLAQKKRARLREGRILLRALSRHEMPDYRARVERGCLIKVAGCDWNARNAI